MAANNGNEPPLPVEPPRLVRAHANQARLIARDEAIQDANAEMPNANANATMENVPVNGGKRRKYKKRTRRNRKQRRTRKH